MHQRGNTELPCRAPLSYWIPLRNGPSESVIIENLHKYKLHRKQFGLLPEGDYQGRPLACDEAPGARDGSVARQLWGRSWVTRAAGLPVWDQFFGKSLWRGRLSEIRAHRGAILTNR